MCPINGYGVLANFWCFGVKVFLLVWIIFVPVVITARLDEIIKLLKEKK